MTVATINTLPPADPEPFQPHTYSDPLAWCPITYATRDRREMTVIWNLRDGPVPYEIPTPGGREAIHISWVASFGLRNPGYRPQLGERYFTGPPDAPRLAIYGEEEDPDDTRVPPALEAPPEPAAAGEPATTQSARPQRRTSAKAKGAAGASTRGQGG